MNDPKTADQINSQSGTPHLDGLRQLVGRLTNLLEDPHPGLFTWQQFYGQAMEDLCGWWNDKAETHNIALRLLVEKWRQRANECERQDIEEAISGL